MSFVLNCLFLVIIFCCFSFIFYQSFFTKTRKVDTPRSTSITLEEQSCVNENTGVFAKDIELYAE